MIDMLILGGRLVLSRRRSRRRCCGALAARTLHGRRRRGAAQKIHHRADGQVVVDYNFAAAPIALDETYAELFSELKSRLRGGCALRACARRLIPGQTVRLLSGRRRRGTGLTARAGG
jgi:hypothetical protein